MRFLLHTHTNGESRRGIVATINLSKDPMAAVMIESEIKKKNHCFGGKSFAAVIRMKNPANFGDLVLRVGVPQHDITDYFTLIFDDKSKRLGRGI